MTNLRTDQGPKPIALSLVGWREILGLFGGLYRKYTDEARMIEKSETLRRVA